MIKVVFKLVRLSSVITCESVDARRSDSGGKKFGGRADQ
jgi:hypothetical protein